MPVGYLGILLRSILSSQGTGYGVSNSIDVFNSYTFITETELVMGIFIASQ